MKLQVTVNSCNATQTNFSPPVPETVSIREINLWNATEGGARNRFRRVRWTLGHRIDKKWRAWKPVSILLAPTAALHGHLWEWQNSSWPSTAAVWYHAPAFFTSQEHERPLVAKVSRSPVQEHERPLVAKVSRSPVQSHETVCLPSCEHSNCLLRLFTKRLKNYLFDS